MKHYGISPWEINVITSILDKRFQTEDEEIENTYEEKFVSHLEISFPYSFNDDWTSMYGKFETSKVHEVNVQIVHTSKNKEIVIKKGTPLSIYIPVKNNKLDMEVVDFSKRKDLQKKYSKYNFTMSSKFRNAYRDL